MHLNPCANLQINRVFRLKEVCVNEYHLPHAINEKFPTRDDLGNDCERPRHYAVDTQQTVASGSLYKVFCGLYVRIYIYHYDDVLLIN